MVKEKNFLMVKKYGFKVVGVCREFLNGKK